MVVNKGADKARREEEKIFFFWLLGCSALAQELEGAFATESVGCPGNKMVVARHREPVYHPESSAVTCRRLSHHLRVQRCSGSGSRLAVFPPLLPPRAWVFSAFLIYPAGSLTIYVIFWTPGMQRA